MSESGAQQEINLLRALLERGLQLIDLSDSFVEEWAQEARAALNIKAQSETVVPEGS